MQYAPEYHTALIAISSVFMAIAGIIVAILVSRGTTNERLNRLSTLLELVSILPGTLCMIYALSWFSSASGDDTLVAQVALIVQFLLMYAPLWALIRNLIKR